MKNTSEWSSPPLLIVRGLMYLLVILFAILILVDVLGVPFALWILLAPAVVYGKTILATVTYLMSGGIAGSAPRT